MSNFRTLLKPPALPFKITHRNPICCIGSCFAAHVGKRLEKYKFPVLNNSLGILYNPVSIALQLERAFDNREIQATELFEQQGLWHHFQFHSRFSGLGKQEALNEMNKQLENTHRFLKRSNFLIITLGTAWVFEEVDQRQIVANCHKVPAQYFEKKLLSVEDSVSGFNSVFRKLKTNNPALNIILTVSPVRHIREGLVENQLSKSTLLLSCARLSQQYDYVHYFPSWEIMMDDLRDYRFYESDMIHPSGVAIDYIWSLFQKVLFSEKTIHLNIELEKIIQASQHRPFQVSSSAHQAFLKRQLEEIDRMEKDFPFVNLKNERVLLEKQMII